MSNRLWRIVCTIDEIEGISTIHIFIPEYFQMFNELCSQFQHPVNRNYGGQRHRFQFHPSNRPNKYKQLELTANLQTHPVVGDYIQTPHGDISIA